MRHPFFEKTDWKKLRDAVPPFVPSLDSELDTGYYDDFTSVEDMAKYAEVQEKQRNVAKVAEKDDEALSRGVWVGFTFGKNAVGKDVKGVLADASNQNGDDDGSGLTTIF